MVALRSTDGGATFTRIVISDLRAADNDPMRAIPLPSLDIDSNGTIYAVWHDCRFRASCARNDMVLSTSADGLTWSAPTRIPLAPASSTVSFFIPGLAADPLHPGRLGLVYAYFQAGSCRKGACLLGIGFAQSRDAGEDVVDAAARRAAVLDDLGLARRGRADGRRLLLRLVRRRPRRARLPARDVAP